mgnify:CR=1 FL=1
MTNKLLAKKADAICVAYSDMERFFPAEKIILTGNPVRADILESNISKEDARKELGLPADKKIILVVGGSLGARTINESIANSLEAVGKAGGYVLWQTGKLYADECIKTAEKYTDVVKATPFISRMDLAYRAADIVVSRAGAGTISELQLLGKPSILIPSPNVAEDHQRKNAEALSVRDAAVMILDADARAELPKELVSLMNDDSKCKTLTNNVLRMALKSSSEKIVDKIYQILQKNV